MSTIVIIPSRLAATRLPNKPLLDMDGLPMVIRVAKQSIAANVGPVYVAAGDQEIIDCCAAHGVNACLTPVDLPTGSDRIHALVKELDPKGEKWDRVINVQGDLPLIEPSSIAFVDKVSRASDCEIATLVAVSKDPSELTNMNVVKAAIEIDPATNMGPALYFSRNPIPSGNGEHYHHIGIYAYKRDALDRFVGLPQAEIEKRERLEQLRAMANGMRLSAGLVTQIPLGVDTIEDYHAILAHLQKSKTH